MQVINILPALDQQRSLLLKLCQFFLEKNHKLNERSRSRFVLLLH